MSKLKNHLEIKKKYERMKGLVNYLAFNHWILPVLHDGFESDDLTERFTIKLVDCVDNKYEPPKIIKD